MHISSFSYGQKTKLWKRQVSTFKPEVKWNVKTVRMKMVKRHLENDFFGFAGSLS